MKKIIFLSIIILNFVCFTQTYKVSSILYGSLEDSTYVYLPAIKSVNVNLIVSDNMFIYQTNSENKYIKIIDKNKILFESNIITKISKIDTIQTIIEGKFKTKNNLFNTFVLIIYNHQYAELYTDFYDKKYQTQILFVLKM